MSATKNELNPNDSDSNDEQESFAKTWIKLSAIEKESFLKDDAKFYHFYCDFLLLLSDLCLDRNYEAIHFLQTKFTRNICIECITQSSYPLQLRSAFVRLYKNLWINSSPFTWL